MRSLQRLLNPRHIAIIGGGAWCEHVLARCLETGFEDRVWPVHPKRKSILGVDAFACVEDLPQAPDAAFVGINRYATIEAVRALATMEAGGATCFASGFREATDGAGLHDQLLEAAGDMPVLGPNCYGFLNMLDGAALWPDVHGLERVDKGVAIITQSSNMAISLSMQKRGLPVAFVVAAGNQSQQSMAAIARHLIEDARVTAIGLHVEGFTDVRGYEKLAQRAQELGKPVIVLKVGRSAEAKMATTSHTGSMAGQNAGAEALIARLGFASARDLPVFAETLKLAHSHGYVGGRKLASISCSGGEASLVADLADDHGLTFPALTDPQTDKLSTVLGPLVTLTNPLDYHTDIWRDVPAMAMVFETVGSGAQDLTLLVLDFPRGDRCETADWYLALDAIEAAQARAGSPFAVVSTLQENMPEGVAKRLVERGIAPLCGIEDALTAIGQLTDPASAKAHQPIVLPTSSSAHTKTLKEAEAKAALATAGVPLPAFRVARSVYEAGIAAAQMGTLVALKGIGFAHKTEAGAVALNLTGEDAAVEAATAMGAQEFLVEEMITDSVAELLVGVVADPAHGFVLTVGAGGIATELHADKQSLLVPAPRSDVESALSSLRIAPILKGYRGRPSADMVAVIDAIMAMQDYVIKNADLLSEVEINPLMATPLGAVAADALIVLKNVEPS
ncbi:MAG: acetate--CoA ligase family protein [Pseudomonadota bacterium]